VNAVGRVLVLTGIAASLGGCSAGGSRDSLATTQPTAVRAQAMTDIAAAAAAAHANADVRAVVNPPPHWRTDPLKATTKHKHQVWVSPTGDTAYGVIRFELPLPLPVELVLLGFISEMKRDQGEARLLYSRPDKALPGLRFSCEGGKYRLRGNMIVRGAGGWVVYAGTLIARPENPPELALAESAREQTRPPSIDRAVRWAGRYPI
jgi:hypothetical protein